GGAGEGEGERSTASVRGVGDAGRLEDVRVRGPGRGIMTGGAGPGLFDAHSRNIEPVEPIEAYLSSADRARLAAQGALVQRAPAKAGMSRYVIGKRPKLNRRLGSLERVEPPASAAPGGTPWDVRWQGPPLPSEPGSLDPEA